MTSLAGQLDRWWETWVQPRLNAQAGARTERLAAAGPVAVRHTFEVGSSQATLLDSVAGVAKATHVPLTIHSVEVNEDLARRELPGIAGDPSWRSRVRQLAESPWRMAVTGDGQDFRCFNRDLREGVDVSFGRPRPWEHVVPLLPFLYWTAASCNAAMVHAGSAGTPTSMGLVGGPSGTGKSTLVVSALNSGLATCGDDFVWLQASPRGTTVMSVFRTIKTLPDAIVQPAVTQRTVRGDQTKDIHWLAAVAEESASTDWTGTQIAAAPLTVCWILQPPGRERGTRGQALAAMLPSTLLRVPGDEAAVTEVISAALSSARIVTLERDGRFESLADRLRASLKNDS